MPLFGSLIVPIYPVKEAEFDVVHGFSKRNLTRLIDFCKDTGRIQFVLASRPINYFGLNYLDDLFTEVSPPVHTLIPFGVPTNMEDRLLEEFDSRALFNFWTVLQMKLLDQGFENKEYIYEKYRDLRSAYIFLRRFGFRNASRMILEQLEADPIKAHQAMYFYKQFIVDPMTDPLRAIHCNSTEYVRLMKEVDVADYLGHAPLEFPCEVGAFITQRLTPLPLSFESCKALMDKYDSYDIRGLVVGLNKAVQASKVDLVGIRSEAISTVLDNVWSEARSLKARIRGVSAGITVGLCAVGTVAGSLLGGTAGGYLGLLSGLGFKVLDNSVEAVSSGLSQTILKAIEPSYVSAVFDFRKKYKLLK